MFQKDTKETDWVSKERREMFVKIIDCYIMKSGSEKDPLIEKIMPIAETIVKKAFAIFPDKNEGGEEKPL